MSLSVQNNLCYDLFAHAITHPERLALFVDNKSLSYRDLAERVTGLGISFLSQFPKGRQNIGIVANRCPEAYIGLLAALWSGNTYVPLNGKLPAPYLRKLIERAEIRSLVIDSQAQSVIEEHILPYFPNIDVISLQYEQPTSDHSPHVSPVTPLAEPTPVTPEHSAYLMFTSGSTGTPKGITATVGNVSHFLNATQERYRLTADDRFSQFNDLTWDPSIFDMFSAWKVGASVHVVPANQMLAPAFYIRSQQLTVWYSGPATINLLRQTRQLKPDTFPSLRLSLFVGEPLLYTAAEDWQAAAPDSLIENVYGPTETTVVCTGQPFTSTPSCRTPNRNYLAIGTPYSDCHVEIIDEQLNFLTSDTVGEIAISGSSVTPGYWHDKQLTDKRFPTLNHPQLGTDRWYLTGDIGMRSPDGTFHFLGRADNQVKLRSLRIELEEVEYHIISETKSTEVAVFAWPLIDGAAQGLTAFIGGTPVDLHSLRRSLTHRIPSYMIPCKFIELAELPRNANGKVDRKALQAQLVLES